MPSDYSFRLSMYLSLALACGCLGYAEADLLPSGAVLAGLVLVALAVAFRWEGRFELGLAAANRLGMVLFVVAAVWLVTQLANPGSLIRTVAWPASLLPYVGTMLLVAMPAKLLRPKHAGDWWALQIMGLAAVTLAAALAEDGVFGLLLVLYAVTAVGGLALFYLKREAGGVPPAPEAPWLVGLVEWLVRRKLGGTPAAPPAVVASAPARVRGAWRPAVGWLAVAAGVALPLFFVTPRSGAARWSMTGVALETGYDSPHLVDLNRTGEVRTNSEVAFEVTVTDAAGRPFDELSPNTRWRGVGFGRYDAGTWKDSTFGYLIDPPSKAVPDQRRTDLVPPPAHRPDVLTAVFTTHFLTREPPLADPVRWEANGGSPAWMADREGRPAGGLPWIQRTDAAFGPMYGVSGGRPGYVQFIFPPQDGEADLGTGFDPAGFDPARPPTGALAGGLALAPDPLANENPLTTQRELPPRLTELPKRTRGLLDTLVANGHLPARVTDSPRFRRESRPEAADWELIAQTFRDHLAGGEYGYTLKLRRDDPRSDPVEDFLYRTKAGNCERFAAALALMCRAVGIPARYVLGFRGCESLGDGKYLVRQEHAHAWVEVLVPRRAANAAGFRWHWLSLDPTPAADEPSPDSLIGSAAKSGASLFHEFIVGYNAERRRQAAAEVWMVVSGRAFLVALATVAGVSVLAVVGWRVRRRWRRRAALVPPAVGWYARLVQVLERGGHPLTAGQTPAEYARAAAGGLPADVAALPGELTALYYRERFGGNPPSPAALDRIDADIRRLEAALPPR